MTNKRIFKYILLVLLLLGCLKQENLAYFDSATQKFEPGFPGIDLGRSVSADRTEATLSNPEQKKMLEQLNLIFEQAPRPQLPVFGSAESVAPEACLRQLVPTASLATEPKPLMIAKLSLKNPLNAQFTFEWLAPNFKANLNQHMITTAALSASPPNQLLTALPIAMRIYTQQSEACLINIEETQAGHLVFSGYLAKGYALFTQSQIVYAAADNQFYFKLEKSSFASLPYVDFVLFER